MNHTWLELDISNWDGRNLKLELRLHHEKNGNIEISTDINPELALDWQQIALADPQQQSAALRTFVNSHIARLWNNNPPNNKDVYLSLYISGNAPSLQLLPWENAFFADAAACGLPGARVQRVVRYVPSVEDPRPQRSQGPPSRLHAVGLDLARASATVNGAANRPLELQFAPAAQLDLIGTALGGSQSAAEDELQLAPQDGILVLLAPLQASGADIEVMLPGEQGLPTYVPITLLAGKLRSLGVRAPRLVVLAPCVADRYGRAPESLYSQRVAAIRAGHQLATAGIPGVVVLPPSKELEAVRLFVVRLAKIITQSLEHEQEQPPAPPPDLKGRPKADQELAAQVAGITDLTLQPDEDLARLVRQAQGSLFSESGAPVVFIGTHGGTLWTVPRFAAPVPDFLQESKFVPFVGPDFRGVEWVFAQVPVRKIAQLVRSPAHREHHTDPYRLGSFLEIDKSRKQLETLYLQAWAEALHRFGRIYAASQPPVISDIPTTLKSWNESQLAAAEGKLNGAIETFRNKGEEFWEKNPYGELAKLKQSVYVVTDPSPLLFFALKAYGKDPDFTLFATAGWNGEMARGLRQRLIKAATGNSRDKTEDTPPTEESPLIIHLFGHLWDPDTLCLTQDDLANWLFRARLVQDQIVGLIGKQLDTGKLLFVGFDVADFVFQLLVRALFSQTESTPAATNTLVSVVPSSSHFAYPQEAAKFLKGLYARLLPRALDQRGRSQQAAWLQQIFWGDGLHLIQRINKAKGGGA